MGDKKNTKKFRKHDRSTVLKFESRIKLLILLKYSVTKITVSI